MVCKKCGATIRREDKRDDGRLVCPSCGAVYRLKARTPQDAPEGQTASTPRAGAAAGTGGAGRKPGKRAPSPASPRRMRRLLLAAVLGILAATVAVVLLIRPGGSDDAVQASVAASEATATQSAVLPTVRPTETALPEVSAHIRAVGDVMVHKLQLSNALQDDGSFDFHPQFEYVKDALSKADYTIANLELSIAADKNYSSFPFFRTPRAILPALKDSGVDLLTLANNHILDGFYDGLIKTISSVDKVGFDRVGAFPSVEETGETLVVDINGIRFGFLAYTQDLNDNDKRIEAEKARGCIKLLDEADFAADVRQLREQGAEVVVCLPHWGAEGKRSVAASCKKYAQQMVEAGVDIILGSHPHVVLPIEQGKMEVNGEEKDVLIAWSMGNFISYMANRYVDSGIIVDFTVTRDASGKIHIHDVGYVPVYVCGSPRAFRVVCSGDFYSERPSGMSEGDFNRMRQSVREISDMIGTDGITMLQN